MLPFRSIPVLAACAALASLSNHAAAETLFGLTVDSTLVSFDSASPGVATSIGAITGLAAGQTLRSIDFRPSNGLLYGISSLGAAAQIYTLDTRTGAATAVGGALTLADTASKLPRSTSTRWPTCCVSWPTAEAATASMPTPAH